MYYILYEGLKIYSNEPVYRTMYIVHCTLYTVYCTLYIVQVNCTLYQRFYEGNLLRGIFDYILIRVQTLLMVFTSSSLLLLVRLLRLTISVTVTMKTTTHATTTPAITIILMRSLFWSSSPSFSSMCDQQRY